MKYKLNKPISLIKAKDKTAYYYRIQELLRLELLNMRVKFQNKEISRQTWDNYTTGLKISCFEIFNF